MELPGAVLLLNGGAMRGAVKFPFTDLWDNVANKLRDKFSYEKILMPGGKC